MWLPVDVVKVGDLVIAVVLVMWVLIGMVVMSVVGVLGVVVMVEGEDKRNVLIGENADVAV